MPKSVKAPTPRQLGPEKSKKARESLRSEHVEEVQGKSSAFSTENPCQSESIDAHSISAYTNDAFVQVKSHVRSECMQTVHC